MATEQAGRLPARFLATAPARLPHDASRQPSAATGMRKKLAAAVMTAALTASVLSAQIRTSPPDGVVQTAVAPASSPAMASLPPAMAAHLRRDLRAHAWAHAEQLLLRAVQQQPTSSGRTATSVDIRRRAAELSVLGGIFFLDHRYLEAAIAFNKARALQPLPAADRFTLAMAYILLRQSDWARPVLARLAREQPRNPLYPYWLGRLDFQQGRFPQCIARMRQVLALNPRFPLAHYRLGLAWEAQGRYRAAHAALRQELRLNRRRPHPSPWPPHDMGILLEKMGHPERAGGYFQQALAIDPQFAPSLFQWGKLLLDQGQTMQAIERLQQATKARPTYARPYYLLARAYQRQGESRRAAAAMRTFRRLQPPAPPHIHTH